MIQGLLAVFLVITVEKSLKSWLAKVVEGHGLSDGHEASV